MADSKTIGEWTSQTIESMTKKAEQIAAALGVPMDEAWQLMRDCNTFKVLETVERIARRQEMRDAAEQRSLSARAATFKSNMESDK